MIRLSQIFALVSTYSGKSILMSYAPYVHFFPNDFIST